MSSHVPLTIAESLAQEAEAKEKSPLDVLPDTMDNSSAVVHVTLHEAHDLINQAVVGDMDVAVNLSGGFNNFRSTIVEGGHTSPNFNQIFSFPCRGITRSTSTITFSVVCVGTLGDSECGHAELNIFTLRNKFYARHGELIENANGHPVDPVHKDNQEHLWLSLQLRGKDAGKLHVSIRVEDPDFESQMEQRRLELFRVKQEKFATEQVERQAEEQLIAEAAEQTRLRLLAQDEESRRREHEHRERMAREIEENEARRELERLKIESEEVKKRKEFKAELERHRTVQEAELIRLQEIARIKQERLQAEEFANPASSVSSSASHFEDPGFTPNGTVVVISGDHASTQVIPAANVFASSSSSSSREFKRPELVIIRAQHTLTPLAWSCVEAFGRKVYGFGLENNLPPATEHSKRSCVLRLDWMDDENFRICHPNVDHSTNQRVYVNSSLEATESFHEAQVFRLVEPEDSGLHRIESFIQVQFGQFLCIDETWLVGWKLKKDSSNRGKHEKWIVERAY